MGAVIVSVGVVGFPGGSMADTGSPRLGIVTPSVVLAETDGLYVGDAVFSLSGGGAASIEADFIDIWSNDQGQRITLPVGSTPLTGADRLAISQSLTNYEPSGDTQFVTLSLSVPSASINEIPMVAGVRVTLTPSNQGSGGSVNVIASAVSVVFAGPDAAIAARAGYAPDLVVDELGVTASSGETDDTTIRPLTFVEDPDVAVFLRTSNTGNIFTFARHTVTIRKAGWWLSPDEADVIAFTHTFDEAVVLPGQSRTLMVDATANVVGSSQRFPVLAEWGLYSLTAETLEHTGIGFGDTAEVSQRDVVHIVVFPLRQALTYLLVGLVVLALVFRVGRHSISSQP